MNKDILNMKHFPTAFIHIIIKKLLSYPKTDPLFYTKLIFIVLWILFSFATFLHMNKQIESAKENFYAKGVEISNEMTTFYIDPLLKLYSDNSGTDAVLPKIPLNKLSDNSDFQSISIVDRNNTIRDHSDLDMIYNIIPSFTSKKLIKKIKGVSIYSSDIDSSTILFSSEVIFPIGNVKLGQIILSFSDRNLITRIKKLKLIYISTYILSILCLFLSIIFIRSHKKYKGKIKNYILQHSINDGGMADLFVAISDDDLRKKFAIKIAKPGLSQDALAAFGYEAQLASRMDDTNIVKVHFYYKEEHAIVMDYVQGEDLGAVMKIMREAGLTKFPPAMAVYIILQVCNGLKHAHFLKDTDSRTPLGIVHRDIKPGNILISYNGDVKITDFGIAKASGIKSGDTQEGEVEVKGTLSYMSPEQATPLEDKDIDHRSDIYSLGIVFYEMLSGKKMLTLDSFENEKTAWKAARMKILKGRIRELKTLDHEIPPELSQYVMKCLEKNRDLRYQSIEDLESDLKTFMDKYDSPYSKDNLEIFMRENAMEDKTVIITKER